MHDKLYSKMKHEGLLDDVIAGVSSAVEAVKQWQEFVEEAPRLYLPKPNTSMEKLKLASWFVNKMGSIQQARKVLDFMERMEDEL